MRGIKGFFKMENESIWTEFRFLQAGQFMNEFAIFRKRVTA